MNVRDRINELGLKQRFVADRIGIDRGHFSLMLSGYRVFPTGKVKALAECLGLSTDVTLEALALGKPRKIPTRETLQNV